MLLYDDAVCRCCCCCCVGVLMLLVLVLVLDDGWCCRIVDGVLMLLVLQIFKPNPRSVDRVFLLMFCSGPDTLFV